MPFFGKVYFVQTSVVCVLQHWMIANEDLVWVSRATARQVLLEPLELQTTVLLYVLSLVA